MVDVEELVELVRFDFDGVSRNGEKLKSLNASLNRKFSPQLYLQIFMKAIQCWLNGSSSEPKVTQLEKPKR